MFQRQWLCAAHFASIVASVGDVEVVVCTMMLCTRKEALLHPSVEAMALGEVFSMQSGDGDEDGSYATNSNMQTYTFHTLVKPDMSRLLQTHWNHHPHPHHLPPLHMGVASTIAVADFGCSHGPTALLYASFVAEMVEEIYGSAGVVPPPPIHYFFNDLPSNDFNSLFKLLQRNHILAESNDPRHETKRRVLHVAGVPGSFHGRLFPHASLHLGVSAFSLHWLSEIPASLLDKASPSWNGGYSWMNGDRPAVSKAFAEQFRKDMRSFLTCRAKELTSGGLLYLCFIGRPERSSAGEYVEVVLNAVFIREMEETWADMISQNLVDASIRDAFNIPLYLPTLSEVKEVMMDVPELDIIELRLAEGIRAFSREETHAMEKDSSSFSEFSHGFVKSLLNPLLEAHMGVDLSKTYFDFLKRTLHKRSLSLRKMWNFDFVCALLTTK